MNRRRRDDAPCLPLRIHPEYPVPPQDQVEQAIDQGPRGPTEAGAVSKYVATPPPFPWSLPFFLTPVIVLAVAPNPGFRRVCVDCRQCRAINIKIVPEEDQMKMGGLGRVEEERDVRGEQDEAEVVVDAAAAGHGHPLLRRRVAHDEAQVRRGVVGVRGEVAEEEEPVARVQEEDVVRPRQNPGDEGEGRVDDRRRGGRPPEQAGELAELLARHVVVVGRSAAVEEALERRGQRRAVERVAVDLAPRGRDGETGAAAEGRRGVDGLGAAVAEAELAAADLHADAVSTAQLAARTEERRTIEKCGGEDRRVYRGADRSVPAAGDGGGDRPLAVRASARCPRAGWLVASAVTRERPRDIFGRGESGVSREVNSY